MFELFQKQLFLEKPFNSGKKEYVDIFLYRGAVHIKY
jgi:hypothetical protein